MAIVKYSATKLQSIGKNGILKPDENGYYDLVIGGLNAINSAGELYTLEGAKELFDRSSIFMRRISNGAVKSEVGHPKRLSGMTDDEFLHRIIRIEETNVCAHISDIWLNESFGRDNPRLGRPNLVAIMGKVAPAGPKGDALAKALENKKENVMFSIRALTQDNMIRSVNHRVLKAIFTFDWVTEPGIDIANKWDAPALESLDNMYITKAIVDAARNSNSPIAMENSKEVINEISSFFDVNKDKKLNSYKW